MSLGSRPPSKETRQVDLLVVTPNRCHLTLSHVACGARCFLKDGEHAMSHEVTGIWQNEHDEVIGIQGCTVG
jgi:hypothetical protein